VEQTSGRRSHLTDVGSPPYAGKSPEFDFARRRPDFKPPLRRVSGTVVPNPLFFLRSNYQPPTIEPANWRMRIVAASSGR